MTRTSARYSARYSEGGCVAVGYAPSDAEIESREQRVETESREQRVESREQRVEPPADAHPQGGACLRNPSPTLYVVTDELKFESQLQTARAFDSGVAS